MGSDSSEASGGTWEDVQAIARRFAQVWLSGRRPSLRRFLGETKGHPHFTDLAVLLARTDLNQRLLAGDDPPLEELLRLLEKEGVRLDGTRRLRLIRLEYDRRWWRGEPGVSQAEYQERFPEHQQVIAGWTPLWTCPACKREDIPLPDEGAATVTCPNTHCTNHNLAITVPELFRVPAESAQAGLDFREYVFDENEDRIGEGGMGGVYRSRDPGLGRELAVKVIRKELHASREGEWRFVQEAKITSRLEHPNIVPVHSIGRLRDGQRLFYTMKLVRGQTLEKKLAACGPGVRARLGACLDDFERVCQAVAYAHQQGVIHRDLKPSNIMVGEFGQVQVMDWGLAKRVRHAGMAAGTAATDGENPVSASRAGESVAPADLLTQPGRFLGTLLYAAPEQVRGETDQVGKAADVFALGALLCEVLTGCPPYQHPEDNLANASLRGRIEALVKGDAPWPGLERLAGLNADPELSPHVALIQLAEECLARDPVLRPPDAGAVAQRVDAYQKSVRQRAEDERVQREKREEAEKRVAAERQKRRLTVIFASFILLTLVGGGAGVLLWWQDRTEQRLAEEHRVLLSEEKTRQALDNASRTRGDLHAVLKKPGGVQQLLNQRIRWQRLIEIVRAEYQQAKTHGSNARDATLPTLIDRLGEDVDRDQADYDRALRLDKIRLDTLAIVEWKSFDYAKADQEYSQVFKELGLIPDPARAEEMALLIDQSLIKEQLLAALDHWAWIARANKNPDLNCQLLQIARLADPDPWRDRARDSTLWERTDEFERLAKAALSDRDLLARQSPQLLETVSHLLAIHIAQGKVEKAAVIEQWLRMSQALHPADFWINVRLGTLLTRTAPSDAIGFLRVAVQIRPDTSATHYFLAAVLHEGKDLPMAIHEYNKALEIDARFAPAWQGLGRAFHEMKDAANMPKAIEALNKAVTLDPNSAEAWNDFGSALRDMKDHRSIAKIDAIDAFKRAVELRPNFVEALSNLGVTLHESGQPGAEQVLRRARDIDPKNAATWYNLGLILHTNETLPGAIEAYNEAVALNPAHDGAWQSLADALRIDPDDAADWCNQGIVAMRKSKVRDAINYFKRSITLKNDAAEAYCALGDALMSQGDFAVALRALQEGHRLGNPRKDWRIPSAAMVERCQMLLKLDDLLPRVLQGEAVSTTVQLALADMCLRQKKRYCDAVRLYATALDADPKAAEDLARGYRYNAARAAAQAAAKKGVGASELGAKDQAQFRKMAVGWLRADLALREEWLEKTPVAAIAIVDDMRNWKTDAMLSSLHDVDELAQLGTEERATLQQLWHDVERVAKKARGCYTQTDHKGQLTNKQREQSYPVNMLAGKVYVIDMVSSEFETLLRLEDDQSRRVAESQYMTDGTSRIIFRPKLMAAYRIVATCSDESGSGTFVLAIREFGK